MDKEKLEIELFHRYIDVPEYTIESLIAYILERRPTGGFLRAALSNDFMGAVFKADDNNRQALLGIARLIHNEVPHRAYGSQEKVTSWIRRKEKADG